MCQLWWANFLWWEAHHLWLEADCLEAEGLEQIESVIAGSEAEGLYDLLQGAITQTDMSAFVGLLLPKRHKWAATAMVLGPTAKESKTVATDPLVLKPEGGASEQGASPYPSLNLRRQQYLLEWSPCKLTWVIQSESIAVVSRDVQRDLQPLMLLFVPNRCWAYLGTKIIMSTYLFNTDTLQ